MIGRIRLISGSIVVREIDHEPEQDRRHFR